MLVENPINFVSACKPLYCTCESGVKQMHVKYGRGVTMDSRVQVSFGIELSSKYQHFYKGGHVDNVIIFLQCTLSTFNFIPLTKDWQIIADH